MEDAGFGVQGSEKTTADMCGIFSLFLLNPEP
jgi:hypothetical protein